MLTLKFPIRWNRKLNLFNSFNLYIFPFIKKNNPTKNLVKLRQFPLKQKRLIFFSDVEIITARDNFDFTISLNLIFLTTQKNMSKKITIIIVIFKEPLVNLKYIINMYIIINV